VTTIHHFYLAREELSEIEMKRHTVLSMPCQKVEEIVADSASLFASKLLSKVYFLIFGPYARTHIILMWEVNSNLCKKC
jgi:hypothetical protein